MNESVMNESRNAIPADRFTGPWPGGVVRGKLMPTGALPETMVRMRAAHRVTWMRGSLQIVGKVYPTFEVFRGRDMEHRSVGQAIMYASASTAGTSTLN